MDRASIPGESRVTLSCPVCGATSYRGFRFGLSVCTKCNLVVDPEAIAASEAQSLLQEDWFDVPDAAHSGWVRLFEAWNNRRTMARIRRHRPAPARVLECGIGSGSLLVAMREAGYEVHGCDLSPRVAEYVRGSFGIDVTTGDPSTIREGGFDVVVMNHVLEHSARPRDMLASVVRRTSPGAVFHLAVPNVASWDAHLPGWTSYEPYHLIYFSPETLGAVAAQVGLHALELTTFEPFSGWSLALLRTALRSRSRGSPGRSDGPRTFERSAAVQNAYRITTLAVGGALYPLRRTQAALGAGEEVILIARSCAAGAP
ncbi:MAG TPA: class I SAM-dependent methyltransferase [Polyangiaceae bacterium]|nr:class I SAM-dependent methyltransferase [Polyangiaceae bacterium]